MPPPQSADPQKPKRRKPGKAAAQTGPGASRRRRRGFDESEPAKQPRAKPDSSPASPSLRKLARDLGIDLTGCMAAKRRTNRRLQDIRSLHPEAATTRRWPKAAAAPDNAAPTPAPRQAEQIDFSSGGRSRRSRWRRFARRSPDAWRRMRTPFRTSRSSMKLISPRSPSCGKITPHAYEKKGARLTLTSSR